MTQTIKSIPLCSRCTMHEINSWINDKRNEIDIEVSQQIRQELRAIKLISGECLVCKNNFISDECLENILRILEKNKTSQEVIGEFRKLFSFVE